MIAIDYRRQTTPRPEPHFYAAPGVGRGDEQEGILKAPLHKGPQALPEPILPRVALGEAGAAQHCLEQYGSLAWMLAKRYFAVPADAEDAVQEAFLSLWQSAGRFDPEVAAEATFVTMIFRRRIIDLVRKKQRPRPEVNSQEAELAIDPAATPAVEVSEEAARIRKQMASLREEERRVIELGVCQGLSQSKIAELTGWPLGTVKSHARRGLMRLREQLAAEGMS